MGTRRTRTKSRPEGGLRRRGSLALLRRAPEREAPTREAPEREAPSEPRAPVAWSPPAAGDRSDERRWREAGGPEDNALYTCTCGYVWEGSVSASVACPNCGTPQAW